MKAGVKWRRSRLSTVQSAEDDDDDSEATSSKLPVSGERFGLEEGICMYIEKRGERVLEQTVEQMVERKMEQTISRVQRYVDSHMGRPHQKVRHMR